MDLWQFGLNGNTCSNNIVDRFKLNRFIARFYRCKVSTLKVYAKGKMMAPPAVKVGRKWMIDREARFTGILAAPKLAPTANPKLRRIIEDGCKTAHP